MNNYREMRSHLAAVCMVYVIAHVWILALGDARYWDDWAYYGAPASWILKEFQENGNFLNISGWIYLFFSSLDMTVYKVFVFASGLATSVMITIILWRDLSFSKQESFWIVAIMCTLPLNPAKVALINLHYSLCVVSFLIGWLAVERHKFISAVFFIFSFSTQSLLVFYLFPFLTNLRKIHLTGELKNNIHSVGFFLALPFVWFTAKQIFFQPYGAYEAYNKISFFNILSSAQSQYADAYTFFSEDLVGLVTGSPLAFLLLSAAALLSTLRQSADWPACFRRRVFQFLLGSAMLVCACFPYWSVGLVPTFWDWDSRHQLLMPFGAGILIFSVIAGTYSRVRKALFTAVICVSISATASNYFSFKADWQKQAGIVSAISTSENAAKCSLFIFFDSTDNAIRRGFRFYEWGGLLSKAIPAKYDRFGINHYEYPSFNEGKYDAHFARYYSHHKFTREEDIKACDVEIRYDGPQINVAISPN